MRVDPNGEIDRGVENGQNTYEVVDGPLYNEEGLRLTGRSCDDTGNIQVVKGHEMGLTAAHEVGHQLMKYGNKEEHSSTGIMTPTNSPEDGRSSTISQETINPIVESNLENQTWTEKLRNRLGW